MMGGRIFSVSLLLFLPIVAVLVSLSFVDYSWRDWRQASCMPEACFCEQVREATVRQPANTWSGLALVLLGLLTINLARRDVSLHGDSRHRRLMRHNLTYATVYAVALIIIGLGTAFFHASLTFVGQFFDLMGMYLLATFMVVYNFSRLSKITPFAFAGSYVLLNIILIYVLWFFPEFRRYVFAVLILVALGLEYLARKRSDTLINSRRLKMGLLFMAAGFAVWVLDITGIFCNPTSLLQGHALWHLLCTAAAGCLYLYYRSECSMNEGLAE